MDTTDINTESSRRVDDLTRRLDRLEAELPTIPARAVEPDGDGESAAFDDCTKAELRQRPQGLDGRSSMNKRELVRALRSA